MNINIHNLFYGATIKKGGFGTFFSSLVLKLEDLKEIEKIVSYAPPYDLPQSPSNEEIENLFPINCAYYRFKTSNNIAVFRSKYTGSCNHTPDRFGNFISHSIIFENNDSLNIPIIFSNFKFRNSLTVEEEATFTEDSRELVYDCLKVDFTFYIDYLNNNVKSLNAFLSILDLLINGWLNDGKKNITLLGTKEENQTIIFALYTLLPSSLINKFSFATYVSNPTKYPFQITGIIKENNISRLDSIFFNLIEVNKLLEYIPQNEFTIYYLELIKKQKYRYDTLIEIINEHNIVNFGKSLNFIPKSNEFFENIKDKTISDYKKIVTSDLSIKIKEKIENQSKNENPTLYIQILLEKLNQNRIYSHKDFIDNLNSFFNKYFSSDINFKDEYFYDFYLKAKENYSYNKSELSVHFLIEFDLNNKNDIEKELLSVNSWLENNKLLNEEIVKLIKKYNDFIKKDNMLNLFKNKKRLEFDNHLKEGKLKSMLLKGCDDFNELDNKDKFDILLYLIWSENEKGKFDITFNSYKELVISYYDEPFDFWVKFFKTKFEEKLEQKHSLSYLKRNFIINSFKENYVVEFSSRIDFTDNEKWWLNDYINENNVAIDDRIMNILNLNKKSWF